MGEQVLESTICVFGLTEPGNLTNRPWTSAIHAGVGPSGIGELTRQADVPGWIGLLDVRRGVDVGDRNPRERMELLAPWRNALVVVCQAFVPPPFHPLGVEWLFCF